MNCFNKGSITSRFKCQGKGFTLIELLCVVALLGLITMIALPAVNNLGSKRNLEIAARGLATDLRKAQQKAVTLGRTQLVEFRPSTNEYRIRDALTEETVIITLPEGIGYGVNTYRRVGDFPLLRFRATGSPCRGGTVGLENKDKDILYLIITPATGRVRISEEPPEHWEIY